MKIKNPDALICELSLVEIAAISGGTTRKQALLEQQQFNNAIKMSLVLGVACVGILGAISGPMIASMVTLYAAEAGIAASVASYVTAATASPFAAKALAVLIGATLVGVTYKFTGYYSSGNPIPYTNGCNKTNSTN
jgi:hypothetical protein